MTRVLPAERRKPIAPGHKHGRLVAIELASRDQWGAALWRFRCDCGNADYIARADQVRRGVIISCGCLRHERAAERCRIRTKHGHSRKDSRSPEYRTWRNMLDRCNNPKTDNYDRYGGRGITVCDRWSVFEDFLLDMGPKPAANFSIGRINNDGHYEPTNCRWEHVTQQARNKSTSRLVVYRGKSMTIAEACQITAIPRNVVDARLNRGWTPERAVTTPVKPYRQRVT